MLLAIEYPHWLMVAGAILIVGGFIGFVLQRNKNPTVEDRLKTPEE
jgi:hypothetical protein